MLCQFLLYSKMNQLCIYIYPLFFGLPSHLGHHRALSRIPCAIQYILISYLFYTQYQQCICVNPNLPIPPTPTPFPPWYPYICSLPDTDFNYKIHQVIQTTRCYCHLTQSAWTLCLQRMEVNLLISHFRLQNIGYRCQIKQNAFRVQRISVDSTNAVSAHLSHCFELFHIGS